MGDGEAFRQMRPACDGFLAGHWDRYGFRDVAELVADLTAQLRGVDGPTVAEARGWGAKLDEAWANASWWEYEYGLAWVRQVVKEIRSWVDELERRRTIPSADFGRTRPDKFSKPPIFRLLSRSGSPYSAPAGLEQ